MYFTECKNLNDLKSEYRKQVMANHPDLGGDEETMKAINLEYERVFNILKNRQNDAAKSDSKIKETEEAPEDFRKIVETLLHIDGIEVELCGSWLWIDGNTYENRAELKKAGCRYSGSKKRWYWRPAEKSCGWSRGKSSMGEIRQKYGSKWMRRTDDRQALTA